MPRNSRIDCHEGARRALQRLLEEARELVDDTRCHCHECWTGRNRHDPHGCTWEDIEALRGTVAEVNKYLPRRSPTYACRECHDKGEVLFSTDPDDVYVPCQCATHQSADAQREGNG